MIRTIQGIFGPLTYERRLVKREGEKAFYPLDRRLGFERYRRYTPYLEFCGRKRRKVRLPRRGRTIKILSPVDHQPSEGGPARKRCRPEAGEYEETMLTVDVKPENPVKPDTLYIEGDGLYIL